MFRAIVAFCLVCLTLGQNNNGVKPLIEEDNVLSPPYFNIATGKFSGDCFVFVLIIKQSKG